MQGLHDSPHPPAAATAGTGTGTGSTITTKPAMRKRGPPAALRIDTPAHNPQIALVLRDPSQTSASSQTMSPATSDSDSPPFPQTNASNKPRSLRNMKRLSLTIPSAQSSSTSLALPSGVPPQTPASPDPQSAERRRRASVASLPATSTTALLLRREEEGDGEGSESPPYADGPVEILPRVWLGSEDNARDWKCLIERGIKSILNVAKEVSSPFDSAVSAAAQPLRPFASTPNLHQAFHEKDDSTYFPAHVPSGRPGMHYRKFSWSHGQSDLVREGFPDAMSFIDQALERGDGVLIHCQCGVSRSATLAIAVVMRTAFSSSPSVPAVVRELKSMQAAYSYVKEKSKWVGPNMSLIYQLLDYERALKGGSVSPASSDRSSIAEEEKEWGRRRQMLDDSPSDPEHESQSDADMVREARELDKAMEDRIVARKSLVPSQAPGKSAAWRKWHGGRNRAGSIASNLTNCSSILSEDLVEEDEEEELLGVGGGFDSRSDHRRSSSRGSTDEETSGDSLAEPETIVCRPASVTPLTARPPPSAPAWRSSFSVPPPPPPQVPATATQSTFDIPTRPPSSKPKPKTKRRPPPVVILPPVPSSPSTPADAAPMSPPKRSQTEPTTVPSRSRLEARRPPPPPLHLRSSSPHLHLKPNYSLQLPAANTPSQTLFVFPPSPTLTTRTPSTMMLTSTLGAFPFPTSAVGATTPRVSAMRAQGRTKSFIGLSGAPTPTTACARVDAKGWIESSR